MKAKLSLKSKFYILLLPSAVLLVALIALLMLPLGDIRSQVRQADERLSEVLAAESFARHYERQLRECAAFIATGSSGHERYYEQSQARAVVDIGAWKKACRTRTGETPEIHREELKKLEAARMAYGKVTNDCDWAIAVARSGRTVEAMRRLDAAATGVPGTVVSSSFDEHLPIEESQLNRHLDTLEGAIRGVAVMRLLGAASAVESMRDHVATMMLAERFARYFNEQVRESLSFLLTGNQEDERQLREARSRAEVALELWSTRAARLDGDAGNIDSKAAVARIRNGYDMVNQAWATSLARARAGDLPGAVASLESSINPAIQSNLAATINKDVDAQQKAVLDDAGYISSRSATTGWGMGAFATLLLLVAIGGTLLVSRMVVGPVVQLQNAARTFGESGGGVAVPVRTRDEIGELTESFNEMAAARVRAEDDLRRARDDLEERVKERTAELEQLNSELLSTNKELNDFAYVVSHDLKAPLRGIGSLASWLATDYGDVLDEEGRRQLELLLDRAKKMEGLIESILEYSRLGRIKGSIETVDAGALVENAVQMIGPPPTVSVTVLGRLPSIRCDRTRMQQVFQNLIGNAVKFIDKPVGVITVSCRDAGRMWEFAVADNGPGIDPRYHRQVFQIFQTLRDADDKDSTGIGLTLVKRIVEMHGGTVWVESEPGEGSTFFFTVPRD